MSRLGTGLKGKNFAEMVREETLEGAELLVFALTTMRNGRVPWKVRMQACQLLMERGYGKPHQSSEVLLNAGDDWLRIFPPGTTPAQADAGEVLPLALPLRGPTPAAGPHAGAGHP